MSEPWLLADIGGTNARFALEGGCNVAAEAIELTCADYRGIGDLLAAGADRLGARPTSAALAIAGPMTGDNVGMTNIDWQFSIAGLRRRMGYRRLKVINDFEAIAWSLPVLGPGDLERVGEGSPAPAPMVALGPGTGLGVSALVPFRSGWTAVAGEGGHASLASEDRLEASVLAALHEELDHVSWEAVLSGPGLVRLHRAVAKAAGDASADWSPDIPVRPEDVSSMAASEPGGPAGQAVALFCRFLGGYAGDLALIFGARGGVFIAGGIVRQLGDLFDRTAFRQSFEAKGRFADYLAPIPTSIILTPYPGLIGLGKLVRENG